MTTLEKCMKVELTKQDLKEIEDIKDGLKIFRNLYQRITWFNNGLEFKEYTTLLDDFILFYSTANYNKGRIDLYTLLSLKRSFDLLYDRLLTTLPKERTMIKTFISECSITLRTIIEDLTEAKTSN